MASIQNLLYHFERTQNSISPDVSWLEKNIQIAYKNDPQLLKRSVQNILAIDDVECLKSIYNNFLINSTYKLNVFENVKKSIAGQFVMNHDENEGLFSGFVVKVSAFWKKKIIQSKRYQNSKYCIQNEPIFWRNLEQQFQNQIYRLSYRTLVFDFHMNKQKNILYGDTEEDKIKYYNFMMIRNAKYIITFFENYPCLLRILSNEMRKNRKYIIELLGRYQNDQNEIWRYLCCSTASQKIKLVDIGLGDSHCDGRKTAMIHLENDVIFYKPRNLTPQSMYAELIKKWNENAAEYLEIKIPKNIVKNNYGWMEDIRHQECNKQEELHTFYKRMGIQMAFLYACNATDFHFENIIAQKDHPIFIDLECLFHVPLDMSYDFYQSTDLHEKLKYSVATSVYSLGILPAFHKESHMDISGLGKSDDIQSVSKIPKFNIDRMRIDRNYVRYAYSEGHRPQIGGNKASLYQYKEDIKQGFKMAYMYIQHHKKEMLRKVERYKDTLIVRYVPKSTQTYATILDLSLHPRFLHNALDRELFIAKFCEEGNKSNCSLLGRAEFEDLMNGDIPYFVNSVSSKDIINSRGKAIRNFFLNSPYQFVKHKINNFHNCDLQFQLKIIENSLELTQVKKVESAVNPVDIDGIQYTDEFKEQQFFIETAQNIAEYLYSVAFIDEQGEKKQFSWLNMILNEQTLDVQAMDDNLYDGLSGMALMYLSIWYITKKKKYREVSENIMNDIMDRIEGGAISDSAASIGAFNGISSVLYTLLNFFIFTQNQKYKECMKKVMRIIKQRLHEDPHLDIIAGTAGALIILIRYYELEKEREALDVAKQCGSFLINKISYFNEQELGWIGTSKKALTGFSHGNAGIVYALYLLNKYLKSEFINTIIKKGITFENNNKVNGQWIDLRLENMSIDLCKWCNGSPGILMSRLELEKSEDAGICFQSKIDIQHAVDNLLRYGFTTIKNGKNICHGVMGNSLILMKYAQETNDVKLENISKNLMCESIQHLKSPTWEQTIEQGVQGLGLLTGLAGIAYGLLYACDQRLPNIITLELGQLTPSDIT